MQNKTKFRQINPKADFPEMERKTLKYWYKEGVVEKYLHKNDKSKKRFSFLDGPITANNPMGVHHAWGRTYKDLWQRFYNMRGFRERFQNGFDCQGLWVEVEVEKELGVRVKKDIENLIPGDKKASIAKFVELCKQRVLKYAAVQTEQSKRLGYFMDWDNSYFTMSPENNYMIWHFLKVCFAKGWIYKGRESVPWCPRCETAISQHEMLTEDYKELTHKSVYMRLPLVDRENEYLLVWTTTPWTIPANIAAAVDGQLDYVLVDDKNNKYWMVKESAARLFGPNPKVLKKVKGEDLLGLKYKGAFDDLEGVKKVSSDAKFHTVIPTDPFIMPINTTEGTGIVHTAVSAGEEDFKLGKKLGLPLIPVIADNADYLGELGFLSGKNAKKHPEIILDFMEKNGFAWKIENYVHRYPACWRCKTELVWKVADEWYIAMDKVDPTDPKKRTLRNQMMDAARKIHWLPSFGLDRELDWLKNMHDWLISKKNRYWGLALPIYVCDKCGNFEVIGSKEELQTKAVEGWQAFEGHTPHKPWIDEVKIKCSKCNSTANRIGDVGNPWLDAGIVPFSTLVDPKTGNVSYTSDKKYWREWFPIDFITESFPGQFKNWFYSLIAMSTVVERINPFKTVLGFATLFGEDGRPMHKSWGNAVEFNEGADKIGVDVMRWMYVTHNPRENMLFGYKTTDETRRKFHLLLWNSYNFFVTYANIDNFQFQTPNLKLNNVLDRWIMVRLNKLIMDVTNDLEKYDSMDASLSIEAFVTDLSQWYIRRSRDRIGPSASDNSDKIECYQTLYKVLVTLSQLLAPFNPFVSDEIYRNLTGEKSVHLSDWPESDKSSLDRKMTENMMLIRQIVEVGHSLRKVEGVKLRQPLAEITINLKDANGSPDKDLEKLIKDELNIKKVTWHTNKDLTDSFSVKLNFAITPELKEEGVAREIVRSVQIKRKELGLSPKDIIDLSLPAWPAKYTDFIRKETLARSLQKGEILDIKKA